jgi:hypothetical protein
MLSKPSWLWRIYLVLYTATTALLTWDFFTTDSRISIYYHILIAFSTSYILFYCLNALSVILNCLAVLPIYGYIFNLSVLSKKFWKWFFIFRLGMELTGRYYEYQIIRSITFDDTALLTQIIIWIVLFLFPSYFATFNYAYRTKE